MTNEHPTDRDVRVRPVLGLAFGIVVLTVLACAVGWLFFWSKRNALVRDDPRPRPVSEASSFRAPDTPRLQVWPSRDMEAYRAAQNKLLQSYGPLDSSTKTARIPLPRAMDLYSSKSMRAALTAPSGGQGGKP